MPRRSTASLAAVVPLDSRAVRLRPPADLPEPERALFARLTAANPPGHFRESDLPLLCQYCTASIINDQAAKELRAAPVVEGRPSPWLTIFEKTNRAMLGLSMRLRVSPQARAPNNSGSRPTPRLSAYEMEALREET
jgi:hypothetical protein